MADLLIPLLLLFAVVGGVLVWALVRQLRELEDESDRPFGSWRDGGPDPVPPWRQRREKPDRPASARAMREASTGRPAFPWQRSEQGAADPPQRAPRRSPVAPEPQPARAEPTPQPTHAAPQPPREEPTPQPARPDPTPQFAGGASPRQQEQTERGRPRRPRQPAWLTLPGQRRRKDASLQRPKPAPPSASRPHHGLRGEQEASTDRPAPLWQRPRGDAPEAPAAPARRSGRCSTCGGTGEAIVQQAGGRLGRGPCPDCQS